MRASLACVSLRASIVAFMIDNPQNHPSEHDLRAMLMNPYHAVTLNPGLLGGHPPMVSEDQWVAANVKLIGEMGAEPYLHQLLAVLQGDFPSP